MRENCPFSALRACVSRWNPRGHMLQDYWNLPYRTARGTTKSDSARSNPRPMCDRVRSERRADDDGAFGGSLPSLCAKAACRHFDLI